MSLELLKERFGHSGVTKKADNKEIIYEKLNAEFNSSDIENLESFKSQDLLDLLKERFSHNDTQNLESFKSQDLFDLLEERFGHSISTNKKEVDNKEKINEKLNGKFDDIQNLKSLDSQHQGELEEKERIIENLEIETSELASEVLALQKEKAVLLDNLNKSKWMEDKVYSTAQKVYEDKIKTMSYVDSTDLIPLLISVSREKQGNTKLNWSEWLKISENKYLFQINESIAKKVFEDTNALIDRAVSFINRRTYAGDEPFNNYSLTFGVGASTTGDDGPYVSTNFNPDTYNLAEQGLTVSYWVKPDVISATSYALGRRAGSSNERFFFGIHNDRINVGIGKNRLNLASATHGMEVNRWYHWVVTFEGQQGDSAAHPMKIYINGGLIYENNWRWTQTGNTDGGENIYFGGRNNNGNFVKGWNFTLDEVAIFDEEKDSDWVSRAYNAIGGTGTFAYERGKANDLQNESGLVGYWRFEEGSGTGVKDLSGNGNHGTLTSDDESLYGLPGWSSDVPGK